jgi:hypothetical protein
MFKRSKALKYQTFYRIDIFERYPPAPSLEGSVQAVRCRVQVFHTPPPTSPQQAHEPLPEPRHTPRYVPPGIPMSPRGSPDLPNPATNLQTTAIRFQTTSNQPPDHQMDPKRSKNTSHQLSSTLKNLEFPFVKHHFSQFHIFRQKPHKKQPRATQRLPNDPQRLPKAFQRLPKVTKITPRTPKMTKKAP